MSAATVLKVQRPLATTDPDAPWLLYSEDYRTWLSIPQKRVSGVLRDALGERLKAYIEAEVRGEVVVVLRVVEDQPW